MIHVLVGILENPMGEICISRRPLGKHLEGYWEFPGGKKEAHESEFEALAREFQEEIGVNIIKALPWFKVEHLYENNIHVCLDIWTIQEYSGIPYSKENQEVKMVLKEKLKDYPFPAGNQVILNRLLANKNGAC